MDELGWRVGLLGAACCSLAWSAGALRRAPKRRSRWERLQDETGPIRVAPFLRGDSQRASPAGGDSQSRGDSFGEPGVADFGGADAGASAGGGSSD